MRLAPFRYFIYVLGTANAVMAGVFFLGSLVFSGGVGLVAVASVLVLVNVAGATQSPARLAR